MVIRRGDSHRYCVDFSSWKLSALELMNTIYVDKYVTNISQLCVWEDTKQIWANIDKALRKYPCKSLGVQYFE